MKTNSSTSSLLAEQQTEPLTGAQVKEMLDQLKAQISKIHHDVNNPITVVSGNAELIRELAKALGVEGDLDGPLSDMEQAIEQLSMRLDRLMIVRQLVSNLSDKL